MDDNIFVHESSYIDSPVQIGTGTKIWHYCHVMPNSKIGKNCVLGQNVHIADGVIVGDYVKIQNNVSIFQGVELEDYVFCGPSCVFTNVIHPRAEINRHDEYKRTLVRKGVTIGANATIICGIEIGQYAFIAAGAVVTKNVSDYALVQGVPAVQKGWVGRHGYKLVEISSGLFICPNSNWKYELILPNKLICKDWQEEKPLFSSK